MTEDTQSTDGSYEEDRHSEEALLCMVKKHKKEGDQHLGEWREDARECYAFRAGDQWNEEDKARLEEMLRVPVVFNRIDPMVEAVAGSEVNNRQQVQYVPRQAGDSGVNDILTGAADYFRDACDAEDEESDAFMDVVTCGVGCTETFLDYIDNPEGMVITDRRDPLSMRWDPSAKKRNLTDKRWAQREEWQDKQEIQDKWPDKADEISASSDWAGNDDGKTHNATLAWLYEKDNTGQDSKTGQLRVIHEQWYELETYHTLIDPFTGEMTEMDDDKFKTLQPRLEALRMNLQSVKKQRKRWLQVFVCGDVVLEFSPVACNECSYKFITGRRDRNRNTWYGLVKAMIDPQKWANKFFSQFLHIINTNAKGGMLIEDGATDNLAKFKRDFSKSDSVIVVNEGALSGGKIQPKPPPVIPPQMGQMMEFAISSLRDVSGLNLEILGMANREQAGVLEQQRKQAALTVLASLFDGLRRYRKEQGRLLVKYITEYLSDGRLVRIIGGDGTERYIPLMKQAGTLEYDVIVDESASTTSQKDKTFAILMQLMPALEKQGVPFSADLLEYTPLPAAMVQKWKDEIKRREQPQQNPPPPPPQMISAQANMKRADAAMLAVQGKAQGDQIKAQSDQMKMAGQQMEMQREAQMQPFEQQMSMQELQLQAREQALSARELAVREQEALASLITAQANARSAAMESLGLRNPANAGIGRTPSVQ
jgi:hypothetical protein